MDLEETNKKLERQVELLTGLIELYEKYRDLLEECERHNKKYPTYYKDTTDQNEPYFLPPRRTTDEPIIW
jgi:tRNA (Thr-GGU) A37 N-methylase